MTKPIIRSLADLEAEKERLKASLKQRKENLGHSFAAIKDELSPIVKVAKTTRSIFTADSEFPLLGLGVEQLTNLIVKKGILRKAGWLPRLVAPVLIKKLSTYLIALKASDNITASMHHFADKLRDVNFKAADVPYPKNKGSKKESVMAVKKKAR
ncbi:hypothetical protein [Niabella soli]|uniref:Uncharacterized protein n=1 Tax=Niabella soli DSM 19437 TaxID=929713 RepID=W0F7K6_9BACT|nr:hypothetical protein [Niabella soli]AHF17444.1 hypothetical protein NIASO_07605 [Niabella soli DSM 19437]